MQGGDKRIERYQFNLQNIIGQGSYAKVFKGYTIDTQEQVAVKMIDKKLFLNAYNLKNIQSEIDIMKMVDHENIVKLHNIYQTTNNMYIITEFCADKDLHHLLETKKCITQSEAKKYLKEIMKGVQYLHNNGVIHRDLKPANILIKDNVCKISDFGFAKSFDQENPVMKSIVGTPLYMSPQLLKRKKYTTKSDLWSIGLIYYQMIHGRTPWPAKNELQLLNGIYNKPVTFSKNISKQSEDFIKKCLQIHQQDRISWQQAFDHPLLNQKEKAKKQSLKTTGVAYYQPEYKQNYVNGNNINQANVCIPKKQSNPMVEVKHAKQNSRQIKELKEQNVQASQKREGKLRELKEHDAPSIFNINNHLKNENSEIFRKKIMNTNGNTSMTKARDSDLSKMGKQGNANISAVRNNINFQGQVSPNTKLASYTNINTFQQYSSKTPTGNTKLKQILNITPNKQNYGNFNNSQLIGKKKINTFKAMNNLSSNYAK